MNHNHSASLKPFRVYLAAFAVTVLFMTLYELIKEFAFASQLSAWQSHLMTISLTGVLSLFVTGLVRQRSFALHEKIRKTEQRALAFEESLLNAIPVAVFYKDRAGRYLGCNAVFSETMGVSSEAMIGKTVYELWPGDLARTYHAQDMALMEKPETQRYEFQIRNADGELRDVSYHKGVFRDETGNVAGIIGVFIDITEKKRNELELAEYRQRLEKLVDAKTAELRLSNTELQIAKEAAEAANQAKSAFLENMSHELRTPLNAILGIADLLYMHSATPEEKRHTRIILDSGRHLLHLIDDILAMAEIGHRAAGVKTDEISIPALFEAVVAKWRPEIDAKGLALEVDLDPALPARLLGDQKRLARTLWHLLGNAVKFSERGVINLGAVLVDADQATSTIRFEVSDQGIGISDEQKSRLFDAFDQGDNSRTRQHGGSGIGLALCKQQVECMRGQIGVESQLGSGSNFWIEVPLAN